MRLTHLVIVLAVAACGGKKEEKSDCAVAVARGVDATIAKRRGSANQPLSPQEQEVPGKLKAALEKACVDDKWSKDVLDCFKTADDIAACKDKLTPEQRGNYTRAAMGVMMQGRGGMPPHGMPPHGMPPAGPGGSAAAPPTEGSAPAPSDPGSAGSAAPAGSAPSP